MSTKTLAEVEASVKATRKAYKQGHKTDTALISLASKITCKRVMTTFGLGMDFYMEVVANRPY